MKSITQFKTVFTQIVLMTAAIAFGIPSLVAVKNPKAFMLTLKNAI